MVLSSDSVGGGRAGYTSCSFLLLFKIPYTTRSKESQHVYSINPFTSSFLFFLQILNVRCVLRSFSIIHIRLSFSRKTRTKPESNAIHTIHYSFLIYWINTRNSTCKRSKHQTFSSSQSPAKLSCN